MPKKKKEEERSNINKGSIILAALIGTFSLSGFISMFIFILTNGGDIPTQLTTVMSPTEVFTFFWSMLSGALFIVTAYGLYEKKRWPYYLGLSVIIVNVLLPFIPIIPSIGTEYSEFSFAILLLLSTVMWHMLDIWLAILIFMQKEQLKD